MQAYRTKIKIKNSGELVLSDLPFRSGQVVEILVLAEEDRENAVKELKALFKETQSLPQAKILTDDDIRAEIEAYRSGK